MCLDECQVLNDNGIWFNQFGSCAMFVNKIRNGKNLKTCYFFFLNRSRITFNKTLNDMKYTFEVNWDMKFSQLCKYCCSSISLQLTFNSYHHNGARNVKSNVFLKNVNHRHQAAGSRLFAYLPITIRLCETR